MCGWCVLLKTIPPSLVTPLPIASASALAPFPPTLLSGMFRPDVRPAQQPLLSCASDGPRRSLWRTYPQSSADTTCIMTREWQPS